MDNIILETEIENLKQEISNLKRVLNERTRSISAYLATIEVILVENNIINKEDYEKVLFKALKESSKNK